MATSRRFLSFVFYIVLICFVSLVALHDVQADEWDGSRKRKPAKREGVTVEMEAVSGTISKVLETNDNYFVRVGEDKERTWVALMKPLDSNTLTQLEEGNEVSFQPGVVMKNYHIKGLKQNFKRIIFSPGLQL